MSKRSNIRPGVLNHKVMATKTGDCVELCETFGVRTAQLSRDVNVSKGNDQIYGQQTLLWSSPLLMKRRRKLSLFVESIVSENAKKRKNANAINWH